MRLNVSPLKHNILVNYVVFFFTMVGWVWLQCRDTEIALQERRDSSRRHQLLCVQHKHAGQQDHGGHTDDNQDVWKCQVSKRSPCVWEGRVMHACRMWHHRYFPLRLGADWSSTPTGPTWRSWVWVRGTRWPWPASTLLSSSIRNRRTNTNAFAQMSSSNWSSWRRTRWVFMEVSLTRKDKFRGLLSWVDAPSCAFSSAPGEGHAQAAPPLPQRHLGVLCRQPAAAGADAEPVQHKAEAPGGRQALLVRGAVRDLCWDPFSSSFHVVHLLPVSSPTY